MNELQEIQEEISSYMGYDDFLRIQTRLVELRKEEEAKLKALGDLQQAYLAANSDFERDKVKEMVARIREISKTARAEVRSLNQEIARYMSLEKARDLFNRLQTSKTTKSQRHEENH